MTTLQNTTSNAAVPPFTATSRTSSECLALKPTTSATNTTTKTKSPLTNTIGAAKAAITSATMRGGNGISTFSLRLCPPNSSNPSTDCAILPKIAKTPNSKTIYKTSPTFSKSSRRTNSANAITHIYFILFPFARSRKIIFILKRDFLFRGANEQKRNYHGSQRLHRGFFLSWNKAVYQQVFTRLSLQIRRDYWRRGLGV